MNAPEVWLSLGLSVLSIFIWAMLMGRHLAGIHHGAERRSSMTAMYVVGLLASIGTFSSALGSAQVNNLFDFVIDRQIIIFVAAVGRGALLAGSVALLMLWPTSGDRIPKTPSTKDA